MQLLLLISDYWKLYMFLYGIKTIPTNHNHLHAKKNNFTDQKDWDYLLSFWAIRRQNGWAWMWALPWWAAGVPRAPAWQGWHGPWRRQAAAPAPRPPATAAAPCGASDFQPATNRRTHFAPFHLMRARAIKRGCGLCASVGGWVECCGAKRRTLSVVAAVGSVSAEDFSRAPHVVIFADQNVGGRKQNARAPVLCSEKGDLRATRILCMGNRVSAVIDM